ILHARIHGDCRAAPASSVLDVIVDDYVIFANHPDTARGWNARSPDEVVAFHPCAIAMTQCQRALAAQERVIAKNVVSRLVGDDLGLAITLLKQVVLNDGAGGRKRVSARAYADGFPPVLASTARALMEVVVVDTMVVLRTVEPDN